MHPLSFFQQSNVDYIEELHAAWRRDPNSVDAQWALFFTGFEAGFSDGAVSKAAAAAAPASEGDGKVASPPAPAPAGPATSADAQVIWLNQGVQDLVHSYRELGHFQAKLDPLGDERPAHPLLELSQFGLSEADLDRQVSSSSFLGPTDGTLRGLLQALQATYCGTLGVEFMSITNKEQRDWLIERIEPTLNRRSFTPEETKRILSHLVAAEGFEHFLHTKYLGQKRFSVEGSESLIPLLDAVIERAADLGAEEVVMGMPHRGRLNVLAHVLNKPYELILSEFEGSVSWQESEGDGDVKYHLGFSDDRTTASGKKIHCSLSYNPSHLELVDPVIQGLVRAKQQRRGDQDHSQVVPLLLHGEAAFTGQGIVPETLNLSELHNYRTGGTIHVIVNNQVGFTATREQTRFTPYPTDVARMIEAPIFHVNGDDPEAVVHAALLAIEFRQKFKVDVMIDLWCFRRRGHNESDDPTYTQPKMYEKIAHHPSVVQTFATRLTEEGRISKDEPQQMAATVKERLTEAMSLARQRRPQQKIHTLGGYWSGMSRASGDWGAETAIPQETIDRITEAYIRSPEAFNVHPKLQRVFASRQEMAQGRKLTDWGCAEMWSIGSLLLQGTPVRLVGQDSERGTFSHRHAVLNDVKSGERYVPLKYIAENQAHFTIMNTMLSELAVLGFEYGYSSADPHTLVMWEAQFGDFVNGAQPIIDQFIVSAESKWLKMNGLVMLLPHGYEGQGPEHSSARLERFLQLCAENNLQVCYPTQPAQYFHLLRRQMMRTFRKPLIIMSPKSLLREERAGSPLADFTEGTFNLVLDDPRRPDREEVRRILFCTGRVFYTLDAARAERELDSVAIVRVEQLYPFPRQEIQSILARYRGATEVYWVQEEPRNMGAWTFMESRLRELLPKSHTLSYAGRDEAASPATGIHHIHEREEKALIDEALDMPSVDVPVATSDAASTSAS